MRFLIVYRFILSDMSFLAMGTTQTGVFGRRSAWPFGHHVASQGMNKIAVEMEKRMGYLWNGTRSSATVLSARAKSVGASSGPLLDQDNATNSEEKEVYPGIFEGFWSWRGYTIRYHRSGSTGQPILCVHGFGGNVDHFRKNLSKLGEKHRAFAVDLLGYGYSSKPDPRKDEVNSIYNFDTWSDQLIDFIDSKIGGERTCITCNSVGGIAGLEASIKAPEKITSVQVMNISLRMLHIEKQPELLKPFVKLLQNTLRTSALGPLFFKQIATKDGVRNVLRQCYSDPNAVTDELVDVILKPGLEHGAVDVFLDFISYSGGPLPETLLKQCPVPVSVVWGEDDPWEKIEWGREFVHYPSVEEFISIPNTGHCPMDENPDAVNPIIEKWAARHS